VAFGPTDAILCRINRPLIEVAFLLIRNKVPCRVLGRDIGKNLVSLIKKTRAISLEELPKKMRVYREREGAKANATEAKMSLLDDKIDTIRVFMGELPENSTLEELKASIERLFSDDGASRTMVTLSSIHKSKGLEFDRVFVLDADKYMPSKWARQDWQKIQESNLCYIAATRARKDLRYISSEALGLGGYNTPTLVLEKSGNAQN